MPTRPSAGGPALRGVTLAAPGEAPRERHPDEPAWRADALARSPHTRLADEVPQPLADFDEARAFALCGEICRALLGDLAPALLLLPRPERRRAQALAAWVRTLFDFARQRGVEGERLAHINRWEFALEEALAGRPVGQPVFVAMAAAARQRPWPAEALAAILAVARSTALSGASTIPADTLAPPIVEALLGEPPPAEAIALAAAALGAEHQAVRTTIANLPPTWTHAARFVALAVQRRPPGGVPADASLGPLARLALLLRARWGRR